MGALLRTGTLVLGLLYLGEAVAGPAVQAAGDPIRTTSLDNGSFRFVQGRTARLLDLGASLSGCRGPLRDGVSGRQEHGSVQARVLDMVRRAGFWYVVMQVDTNANCDIQGACGAATDSDVLWLRLTPRLALAARQAVPVSTCLPVTELVRFSGRRPDETQPPALELSGGVLALESRTEAGDAPARRLTLRYDRRAPERGLNVKVSPPR